MPPSTTPVRDALHLVFGILGGVLSGKVSCKTIGAFSDGLKLGKKLKKHYLRFPTSPDGFDAWKKKADKLWNKVGKMQ